METRSVFVAIVGKPNVGKSSLLNSILGQKIAIVTNKPQTTRTKITGILTQDNIQYVFIDTPGIHKPKTKLSRHMIKSIIDSVNDVDVSVLVIEPEGKLNQSELDLIEDFKRCKMPAILVINKVDTIPNKEILMERIIQMTNLYEFDSIIPISVIKNDGVNRVLSEISKNSVEGVHYFPEDALTDQPEKVIIAEIIREKILKTLHQEIPHGTAVGIEKIKKRAKGITDIEAIIYCEKDSHKGMIIGKNGDKLKYIASTSRQEIESFIDCKVNLQCWVKVKQDWRNKETLIKSFGLS